MFRTSTLSFFGVMMLVGLWAAAADQNKPATEAAAVRTNPFLTPSPLPFQAPPFDKIRDEDFKPALEEGIRLNRLEAERIADDPAPATFENTLVALERSGQLLARVGLVFNGLSSSNTNPNLQKLQEEVAPKFAALQDAIFLNSAAPRRLLPPAVRACGRPALRRRQGDAQAAQRAGRGAFRQVHQPAARRGQGGGAGGHR
jgi:hypothetical protein